MDKIDITQDEIIIPSVKDVNGVKVHQSDEKVRKIDHNSHQVKLTNRVQKAQSSQIRDFNHHRIEIVQDSHTHEIHRTEDVTLVSTSSEIDVSQVAGKIPINIVQTLISY